MNNCSRSSCERSPQMTRFGSRLLEFSTRLLGLTKLILVFWIGGRLRIACEQTLHFGNIVKSHARVAHARDGVGILTSPVPCGFAACSCLLPRLPPRNEGCAGTLLMKDGHTGRNAALTRPHRADLKKNKQATVTMYPHPKTIELCAMCIL